MYLGTPVLQCQVLTWLGESEYAKSNHTTIQSEAGAWLPVGVGLLGRGGKASRELEEKGELVHSRVG